MKIEIQKPNVLRIVYRQEKGDPLYGRCLWAFFDFDLDLYMLNIQSDCGNAGYRWTATPDSESFLHLMARCDYGYMLDKLFDSDQLDVEAILHNIDEQAFSADDRYIDDDEREMRAFRFQDLEYELSDCETQAEAAGVISEWAEIHGYDVEVWQAITTDYPARAKMIIQIFQDYVQPKIREMIEGDANLHLS